MAFVGIKKLIKEDKEETKKNISATVAEQIKAGLLAGLGKRAYPEDWQDITTGRVTTPKTTTTTESAPKTTTARKTVNGTPRGTENIARTISPETAPVSPLTQRFSQESVAARLGKSSNTVRAEDPWVNWLIENGHIDNTGRVQGKVTGPISKEAYRELEQNMSDYKARNRIAADTGTAFGNVQRNSPLAQYNSLSPDDKASFYRAGSDKVRDITSFAGAQQYVAGLGYDVSEAWQEMHKWDTTLKNHQKAGQEQNKRRQDLENMLPESGVIRQRLVHGAKVPFTERPDNYNDYSEEYDRQLYDFFYGKGEHDKIMKIGNRQQKEKLMDDLNEMWRNVDNGTFAAYDQQNRQITDNLLKEERANMLAEYAEDQKKQAEHDYNTAKNYQAFRDIYREKYGTTSTPYTGEDLGRTSLSMNELDRGVHTTDADRIFSFLTGGKEYEAYQSMYVNGKMPGNRTMQVTDEYNFAMLMSPDEQNEFKEVYINDGKKAAEAYMAGLHSTGVLRERYSQYEKIRAMEFGGEFPIASVAASLMNDTANTIITPFRTAAGFLGYQGASDPNDVSYKPAMTSEYLQQGFTENIRNKFGDTAAEAAGVALNTVQNIFRAVMTRGLGLADKAQEVASLALFGADVFGKNTYKYLDKGYGLNESYTLAGIDSAIEVLEEKIPTDVMLGGVGKSFWSNLRNSALSELIQEGAGATLGEKAKGVLTGKDSERQRAVELFAEGMTDENGKKIYPAQMGQEGINLASGQARKEYLTEAGRSAIGGLTGGGLGAAYGGIVNTANNINLGRAINSNTNTVDGKTGAAQLAALAKESNDAEIREAGEKLDKKISGGKKSPSNYAVGKLAGMLYQGTAERMQTVVQDTMVRSIRDQIMTGAQEAATMAADAREAEQHEITQQEAQHYAEIIAKSVLTGKNPTNTELQELSKSEDAIQAWKSFNTRDRVADMAAEIRKEAAPMNSVMDTLGDLTSKVAKSRSAAAPDIDAAIKEAGGDTAAAIDNLQARRSDLISESFAGKMKDILKSDKGGKQSKNFLDDAVKIMLGAKTLAKTAPKTRLDSETAQKLFDAAKEEFEAEDNNRVLKQETVKPGEGKASFEGVEYGTKEWQQKVSGLSKTQRNQMGALGEIATRAGLKVTFINDAKRSMINGYENNDGSIVINIAARNRSGLGHHMLTTMSHEMTHWLEQNSREGYNALRQFIVDGLRNSGTDVETRILQIMDNQNAVLGQYEGEESQGLSVNGAMAELVAQGCENLLSSETMMQELAEANPSAFSKVKTFVTNFVARIRNAVKGMSGSLSYEARTLIGQTEQIAKLWSSARAEALARNAEEGAEAQAGTQYSTQAQTLEQAQEMDTEEYRQIAEQAGLDAPQMLRYSMVGPRAGGDYAEMIRQARQMEKQGEDAETIFRETGARKGFRGHWWVTLDNQNIRMKENFDTDSLSQYAYDLADVMDAEELMTAYPQLGVVKVQAQEMGRAYAAYVKDQNTIVLNEEELKKNPGKINVALRHEIQHVIQDIEGANGGANMSRWQDIISRNNMKEDPLDLYWRTAGELEANITSKDGGTMPTREQYARAVAIEDYAPGFKGWKSRMEGRLNRHFSMADISAQDQEYAEAVASGNMKKATEMLMEKLKHSEDIIPYSAPHGYGGQHKTIARMIKEGTPEAVARAAQDLATYVPDNAVLVPMPPHEGTVTDDTDTMILARAVSELTGRPVVNALASNPRESRYQAKSQGRKGLTAEEMGFRKIAELPEGTIPIFVDNVVGSGETAKAANLAMGGGVTLAYAKGTRTQGIRGLKEANVTYDKAGNLIPLSQRFNPEIRNVKYSTAELNAAYMDAAERGDTETAKKLMEAYAAGKGYTIRAYHGTGRADRVGTVFLPERATSGPMAFFTDNRSIAENYARDKQDTSIAYDEEYGDYFHQFRVPGKNGKTIPVGDLWKQLSYKEKRDITEKAKHINWDEDVENIIFDPDTNVGNGGFQDWTLREKHGNAIEALIEAWLQGGDLYGREADFLDVLKMVGIENATWNDPDARHEKVYDVFLKIQNPFSTGEMYNQSFLDGLAEWWEEQDWDAYQKETANADPWDKNSRSVEDWIEQAERDLKNGSSHAWTSIPDAVTDYLKSLGHDGIQDVGGKNGGETHTVWIPFSSEQVKSAEPVTYDDQGNVIPLSKRFNSKKTDIRYSTAEMDEQYMQAVRDGDEKKTRELTEMAAENEMKKSRIRTKDGKLRKVYHGTNSDTFTVFDKGTIGMGSGDTGYFGRGFYFAYSRGEAGMYGRNVMEAYVNIENPFNFEKELNTYNGVKSYDYNASRAVFLMNWADKFPELTKGKTIRVSKIGSNDVENISYKQFADEFKKIYKTKKFDIEETEENGEKIWLVTADKHKESFTNEDGETFEWDEYGFQRKYYNERDARNQLDNAYAYMSENVYDMIKIPASASIVMDSDLTETLKARGYDGVIQSEDGDEVVAFESNQIKLADPVTYDDQGNVIPLSERFNYQNNDIRYSTQEMTAEEYADGEGRTEVKQGEQPLNLMNDSGENVLTILPGNTVAATRYSLASYRDMDERGKMTKALKKAGYTQKEIDKWLRSLDSVANIIASNRAMYDFVADRSKKFLKDNGDVYKKTLDASTMCKKTRLYNGTFNVVQHMMPNTILMPEDLIDLFNIMKDLHLETPCGFCYVQSRRRQLGPYTDEWLKEYKGDYIPTVDEVTTSDGLEKLKVEHPQTYTDFVNAMNAKGVNNPKLVQQRTDYRGEIRKMRKSTIDYLNRIGGLRIQSFSDFEVVHMLDMMQAVMDMKAMGLTSQAYTKVPEFAWIFGNTGIKINLSLVGKGTGLDANGKLVFDNDEGMPYAEAMRLRKAYSKNVGTILVGINDEHIIAAMGDDTIDFIIPFHKSGWSANELAHMRGLEHYSDYTESQNEYDIKGIDAAGNLIKVKADSNMDPLDYWEFEKDGEYNARKYLRLCKENHIVPKFAQFLTDNKDGSFSLPEGNDTKSVNIRKGYWKTLIDFKMYDNEGNGSRQEKVEPNFNMDEAMKILEQYDGSHRELPESWEAAEEFVKRYKAAHPLDNVRVRYSTQDSFSVQNATDMDVNNFMMGLQETSLDTLQEKTMLRQYKDLKTSLDVQRLKIDERTKELRKLEAKKEPNAKDRNDMIRLRNQLDTDTKKRDRLEEQIVKVTSSEGYAGLMYRQHRVMMDLANGKTADDVKRTISGIQSSIEGLDRQISEREAEIREMAESTPIKAIQAMINDKDLDRLAAYLRKTYNSKLSKQEIMQDMAAIRLKMANKQKVDDDIEALTRKLIGGVRGEGSVYLDLLRGMTITLSRDQVKELAGKDSGIAEVRRMLAGSGIKVKQGKAGGSLDANWNELCDMIPALNRDTNEKDQIDELIRFVQSQLQSTSGAAMYQDQLEDAMTEVRAITASVGMDMAQDPAAVRVVQRMMGLMAEMQRGMKGSAAELKKAREQLAEMSRQGAMAGRLSGDMEHNITSTIEYLNKLSEQSEAARWRKERVRLIEQLKSETTEKLLQEQAKWKARIEKDKTVRGMMNENMSLRKKIHTNVSRIQKLLVNETDLKNIPEHMKGLARLMVGKVLTADMSGGRKITGLDPRDMAEIMRVIQAQIEIDGQFDESDLDLVGDKQVKEEVAKALADIEDGISFYKAKGGKDIIANLQGMKNALTRLSEGVATITSIINSERSVSFWDRRMAIEDAAFDVMQDNKNSRFKGELAGRGSKLIRGIIESVGYGNMTPVYFFKNLRNRGMTHHWQEMENAEHRNGLLLQKAKAFVQELAQRTHFKDWAEKTITVNIGKPTEMTVQQAMEILAIWKREQIEGPENSTHLSEGGFVLKTDENKKGKLRRERSSTMPVRIGAAEIAEIEGKLTDEQKQYMEAMVGYLSNEMSDLGNEASMRMYGIKKYKEKYYFPMATWEGQTNARSDRGSTIGKDENRAAHKSWSKRRKNGARSTLVIGNFTEDAVKHITEMINYNTLAPAIEALNKVLNFQVDYQGENMPEGRVNIRTLFARDYGKQALKYLETLMQDMNGGVAQDQRKSLRDRALTMFKKNAVAGSLSVAAQQPLSYVRAAMMLSPRDLAQALMPQYYRGSWTEMMKHSGVAVIKEMGRFDMNFGQSARDFVSPDTSESLPERVVDKLNILPTIMDRMTWTRMWSACKIEQHRLHPEMDMQSDAFLDLVGERFNDVMRKTQVYDSVLVKSSNMRSPNLGMKVLTSFMAEPTVSLNVLEDAVRNARDKGGVALVAKAGATFALSAVLQALIKGFMSAGRSPDDKKTAEENFLYKWQTAFMSEANPLGLIPGYSDLIEVLKNGELTDDAMSAVGKLKSVIDKAGKALSGQGQGVYRDLEDTAGQLAQMFTNVPAKNIMRDMRAMLTWVRQGSLIGAKDFASRESSSAVKRMQAEAGMYQGDNLLGVINTWLGEAGYKTTNKAYYGRMYQAMQAGNDQEAADIREYLMLGKGVKEEDIDSGLRSQAKADSSLGEAERSEWLIDQGLMSGTNTITTQLKKGKISAEEARKLMKQADPQLSDDEIWWKVDQISWQLETGAEETRGKNYRMMDAVGRNKSEEINRVVKEMMAHGVTQKQIKDYMGDLKQEYLAADSKGKVRIRDAIQKVYKAIGLTAAEADKRINKWK